MGHDRGKEVRSMAWIALSAFLILLLTAPVRAAATFVVEKDVQFGFGIRVGWFHSLRCGIVRRAAAGRYEAVLFDENDRPCGRRPLFSQKRNSDQIKRGEKSGAFDVFSRASTARSRALRAMERNGRGALGRFVCGGQRAFCGGGRISSNQRRAGQNKNGGAIVRRGARSYCGMHGLRVRGQLK